MKRSLFALVALIGILNSSPKVMAHSGIGTPNRTAALIELYGQVTYTALQTKQLTEYVDGSNVTGFVFEELQRTCDGFECQNAPQETFFAVQNVETDGCGSTIYKAEELNPAMSVARTLTVVDNSARVCDDYRPFVWQVSMHGYKDRFFGGNPNRM